MSHVNGSDGYRLGRDLKSSVRLNAQHYLWREACGFNIDPRIPAPKNQELRVADVGTGTGIWMLDVQPGTQFRIDGLDMDLRQLPPPSLLPPSCSARKLDILGALPADLENVYDIVNVRLIQGGLQDDPSAALKNLLAMLKPCGYLQWQEIVLHQLVHKSAEPGMVQSNMEALVNEVHEFGFGKWTSDLAALCTKYGFDEAKTKRYPVPGALAIPFCQTQLGAYAEISWGSMDNSSPGAKGYRFRELLERADVELSSGVVIHHELEVTVARKAS